MKRSKHENMLSTAPAHESNPFLPALTLTVRAKKTNHNVTQSAFLADRQSGEILPGTPVLQTVRKVDTENFVKVFATGVERMQGLTKAGLSVFALLYLQMRSAMNSDHVHMSFQAAEAKRAKMSRATFLNGMNDLLKAGIIGKSTLPGLYWINPECLFNGDRCAIQEVYVHDINTGKTTLRNAPKTITGTAIDPDQIDLEEAIKEAEK